MAFALNRITAKARDRPAGSRHNEGNLKMRKTLPTILGLGTLAAVNAAPISTFTDVVNSAGFFMCKNCGSAGV